MTAKERDALIDRYAEGPEEVRKSLEGFPRPAHDPRVSRQMDRGRDRPPPLGQRDGVGASASAACSPRSVP